MSKVKAKPISELFELFSKTVSSADWTVAKILAKISTTITKARIEKKMSQKEFADFLGVTQGMVSKWESSNYNYTIESLVNICDKLNYDIDVNIYKNDSLHFSEPQYEKSIKIPYGENNIEYLYKAG